MDIEYTMNLRTDGEKMARAAARDLDAHVPTCPEWNVAKLVIHTGQHHRWVADAVRGGGTPPERPGKPGLRGDELIEWFRAGWQELADLLDDSDDETPAWSWSGDNRVGFWRRRTTLETLVHRWDAENATGTGTSLDPELSSDGIDEMLFVMLATDDSTYKGKKGVIEVGPTDAPGAWVLPLEEGTKAIASRATGDGSPDGATARITGPAESLLLFLWGRLGPEAVTIDGDRALFDDFRSWAE
ncbi:MAG: hypothetical protein QOH90_476 [Actinomycetota bacterium]|nr:hypothetical protein [Actinomycetota bacterium]